MANNRVNDGSPEFKFKMELIKLKKEFESRIESLENDIQNYNSDNNLQQWKWLHEKLSKQIDVEFTLISNRTSALLAGNSFLFTGFILGINTLINYKDKIDNSDSIQ